MSEYLEKSAGRRYVERTKEEFDALLVERLKFQVVKLDGCGEVVYDRVSADKGYIVRVYSSLQIGTGRTRECGDDAVRVVMVNVGSGFPMKIMGEGRTSKAGKRINRTKGAMQNLEHRVKQYLNLGSPNYRCPACGAVMAVRNGRKGKFLGCTNKRDVGGERVWCKGTRPAPEWIDNRRTK